MIGRDGSESTGEMVVEKLREDGGIEWWEEYEALRRTRLGWWVN